MKRVTALLITLALIAGLVGCPADPVHDPEPEPDPDPDRPVQYVLAISSSEGGEVTIPGEGSFTYDEGTVVSLVEKAEEGYRFVDWTGDVDTIFLPDNWAQELGLATTITMSGDYSIRANFEPILATQYKLTVSSTSGGSVTMPGEGTFRYDAGTVADLVAQANHGYKFLNWTGDVETIADLDAASTKITMNDDYALLANFIQEHIYLDKIGPGLWGLFVVGQGVEAAVTDEGVVVNIASDPAEDPEAQPYPHFLGGGWRLDLVEGDFDIRMTYELTTWPQRSGVCVGLTLAVPDVPMRFVNVERIGLGPGEYSWLEPREIVRVLVGDQTYSITGTQDLAGALRIRREGALVSCYYEKSGTWHKLHQGEWSSEGVRIMVGAWSSEQFFGGEEVSVVLGTVEVFGGLP